MSTIKLHKDYLLEEYPETKRPEHLKPKTV